MLVATACLDGTPEYRVPTRAPPVIITANVEPSTTEIILVPEGVDHKEFNVPFRSEDAGEPLRYVFFEFLDPSRPENLSLLLDWNDLDPDPRPYDEQTGRSVAFTWTFADGRDVGCVPVTMILLHTDNVQQRTLARPVDETRAARITWWFDFADPTGTVVGCVPDNSGGM